MEKKIQIEQPSMDTFEQVWNRKALVSSIFSFLLVRELSKICPVKKMFLALKEEENERWKQHCIADFEDLFEETSHKDDHCFPEENFDDDWHHYKCGIVISGSPANSAILQSLVHDWQALHQSMHILQNVDNMMKNAYFDFFGSEGGDCIHGFILQADSCSHNWNSSSLLKLMKPNNSPECKEINPRFWSIVTGEEGEDSEDEEEEEEEEEEETNETHEAFKKLKVLLTQSTKNVQQYVIGDLGGLPVVIVGYRSGYLVGALSAVAWT